MDMNIIISIIGAIGGAEGLRWVITSWMPVRRMPLPMPPRIRTSASSRQVIIN